jgi:hypothetical protein
LFDQMFALSGFSLPSNFRRCDAKMQQPVTSS